MSGQLHAPAALLRGKWTRYLLDRRVGGLQSQSGRCEERIPAPCRESNPCIPARSLVTEVATRNQHLANRNANYNSSIFKHRCSFRKHFTWVSFRHKFHILRIMYGIRGHLVTTVRFSVRSYLISWLMKDYATPFDGIYFLYVQIIPKNQFYESLSCIRLKH